MYYVLYQFLYCQQGQCTFRLELSENYLTVELYLHKFEEILWTQRNYSRKCNIATVSKQNWLQTDALVKLTCFLMFGEK